MTERVIKPNEKYYRNLKAVAAALEMLSPNNARYVVEDVYLDYGQDWMWTTICRRDYRDCQVLSPREWKIIMELKTADDLSAIVNDIRNDKYFGDK